MNLYFSVVDLECFVVIGKWNEVDILIDVILVMFYNFCLIEVGVDFVFYFVIKYFVGYNDFLVGVVIGQCNKLESVCKFCGIMGLVNLVYNIYLFERGLKIFELRMWWYNENGFVVVKFFEV